MRGAKRGVAKRVFRAPLTGDPGIIPEHNEPVFSDFPSDAELDAMPFEQLKTLALSLGVRASLVCGISSCKEHAKMLSLVRPPSGKYSMGLDVLYCNNCFTWWREKKPLTD